MTKAIASKAKRRATLDTFFSLATQLGVGGVDKRASLHFQVLRDELLIREDLEAIYYQEGMAAKIIDLLPFDMLRKGFKVNVAGDSVIENKMKKKHRALGTRKKMRQAATWARLYGGGAIIIGANDGQEANTPIRTSSLKDIKWISVLHRHQIRPWRIGRNPLKGGFGSASHWELSGDHISASHQRTLIHTSRVIPFTGVELPEAIERRYEPDTNIGFGSSILQRLYSPLRNYVSTQDNVATMIQEFNQAVFQIVGLSDMIAQGDGDLIRQRLLAMQFSRSVVNALLLEEGETFDTKSIDVKGLADLMDKFILHMAAIANTPVTRLMGQSPAGMDATGEGDAKAWMDWVSSQQEDILLDPIEYLSLLIFLSQNGPTQGEVPDAWEVEFPPLFEMTQKEEAEVGKAIADKDAIYLDHDVVSAQEVRKARFAQPGMTQEIDIKEGDEDSKDIDNTANAAVAALPPGELLEATEVINVPDILAIVEKAETGAIQPESALALLVAAGLAPALANSIVAPIMAKVVDQTPGAPPGKTIGPVKEKEKEDEPLKQEQAKSEPPEGETLMSAAAIGDKVGTTGAVIIGMHKRKIIRGWKVGSQWRFALSEVLEASHRSNEVEEDTAHGEDDKDEHEYK